MTRKFSTISIFAILVANILFSGCSDKKSEQAQEQRLRREQAQEKEFLQKKPFEILVADRFRKKGSGKTTIKWESNRNIPLAIEACDKNGEGMHWEVEPVCLENGHCLYQISFTAPLGSETYLTFYDPEGRAFLKTSFYTPDIETMVLTEEIF